MQHCSVTNMLVIPAMADNLSGKMLAINYYDNKFLIHVAIANSYSRKLASYTSYVEHN